MKRTIVLLLILLPLSVLGKELKVGFFLMPPFIMKNKSSPSGISGVVVEYFEKSIGPGMGVKIVWRGPISVLRLYKELRSGQSDLTPMLAKTPDRLNQFRFADTSVVTLYPGIAVMKSFPLDKLVKPSDLFGKKLVYLLGSPLPTFIDHSQVHVLRVGHDNWAVSNLEMVQRGRVDGAFFPNIYQPYYLIKVRDRPLKVLRLPGSETIPYTVFSPKMSDEKVEKFNQVNNQSEMKEEFQTHLYKYIK